MSHISQSVLDSISKLVGQTMNYVCLVEFNRSQWYLALGRECFYFFSSDLRMFKDPPIPYSRIGACRLCKKKKTLM